jgi:hypothetical protein
VADNSKNLLVSIDPRALLNYKFRVESSV